MSHYTIVAVGKPFDFQWQQRRSETTGILYVNFRGKEFSCTLSILKLWDAAKVRIERDETERVVA